MANQSLQFKKITTLPSAFEKGCVYFYTNGTEKSILLGTGTTGTSYIEFKGTDINTWRAININGTSIGQNAFNIASGTGVTVSDDNSGKATVNLKTAATGEIGGIKIAKDNQAYSVTSQTSNISANVTSGKYYGVEIDKDDKAFVYVPWTDTKSFTITATATDDDVVVLTGTNGSNGVTYDAKHAKKGPSSGYTSGNSTTSISGSGASKTIKIPQLTVDAYGHVTAASDESVTITMPTIPESLKNPNALTFGSKTYDGSAAAEITAADLGLGSALKYCGITTTALTDGAETNPVVIGGTNHTATAGCVVFYGDKEFVFNGTKWELLGAETTYKVVQTAVSSPDASGTTNAFIDTISQDANGVITPTKKTLAFATTSAVGGLIVRSVNTNDISVNTDGSNCYGVNLDKSGKAYVALPNGVTKTGTVTSVTPGTGLTGTSSDTAITGSGTINLKTASTSEIGGIKVGSVKTSASGADTADNANKFAVHVDSNGLGYVAIPQYSNNAGTITEVAAGSGLTGGATSGKATLSHADTSTLEGTYGQASNVTQSAKNTATFVVPEITVDGFGHVTGVTNRTITVTDTNTTYTTLKNPNALAVQYNGTASISYDGSSKKTLNIKAGTNVSVAGDTSGNITISATDTTYSAGSGLELSGTTFNSVWADWEE